MRQCYVVKYMLQSLIVCKQAHVMAQDVEMVQMYCGLIPSSIFGGFDTCSVHALVLVP